MSNKFRFVIPNDEQYILLPIELKWDMYGQEDSIELYEEDVIKDIIGVAEDFELLRVLVCFLSLQSVNVKSTDKVMLGFLATNK